MNSLVIETLVGKLAYVGVNLLLQSRFWVFSNLHSPVGWHLTQKNLKFRQDFEAEVWLVFCCSFLVDVTKFNLGQVKILKLALAKILSLRMLTFGWDFEVNAKSRFWNLNLIKICVRTRDMNSTLGSVVPLAMFDDNLPFFKDYGICPEIEIIMKNDLRCTWKICHLCIVQSSSWPRCLKSGVMALPENIEDILIFNLLRVESDSYTFCMVSHPAMVSYRW